MPDLTPNQGQLLTLVVVIVATMLLICYDVLVIYAYGVDASISRVMRRLYGAHPTIFAAIVFWLGVLIGHIGLPTE